MSMLSTEWQVLLVDDEPDVINISKLVMANFEVYGQPLKLHIAQSKAEAIKLLDNDKTLFSHSCVVSFSDSGMLKILTLKFLKNCSLADDWS